MDPYDVLRSMAEALLIGFLVGAEREASRLESERQPGVRDFILIAQAGAVCGLLNITWLTASALLSISGLLAVFHFQAPERSGVTTEMAAVATFLLALLTASPGTSFGPSLAVGLTIVMVFLLEAKRALHKLVRETITETEFNDTLRFLALIFIIYPVLPGGSYGPYHAFAPRQIWLFVILVSSISFVGYFLEKFLGARAGLPVVGLVGGLASTTAATASFARGTREQPKHGILYAQAAIYANAMQFPRILAILAVARPELAGAMAVPLAVMTAVGLAFGWLACRPPYSEFDGKAMGLRNPLRLLPALRFGALFAAILFLSKVLSAAGLWVAAVGGSVDADAAVLAAAALPPGAGSAAVLLALGANALVKTAIAAYAGTGAFAGRLALAFAVMFAAGALCWLR